MMEILPPVPAEHVMSDRLRIRMVDGDGLEPQLMSRRDYVLLAPVNSYQGEGAYLLDWGAGPALYQAQSVGGGRIRIRFTNPLYRDQGQDFPSEKFNEMALGYVVADVKVRDERALRNITGGRA